MTLCLFLSDCPGYLDWHQYSRPIPGLGRVPHDVELVGALLLPLGHSVPLPGQHEHVQVPDTEHPHSGVTQHQEPPPSAQVHLVLQHVMPRQLRYPPHIAEVEAGVVTLKLTEELRLVRLGRGHVVIYPHPPSRVQRLYVLTRGHVIVV